MSFSDQPQNIKQTKSFFLFGIGLVSVFFLVPITKMPLEDNQSFFLGSWDGWALFYFCSLTYVVIPILFGILFSLLARSSLKAFQVVAVMFIAFLLISQLDYFYFGHLQKALSLLRVFKVVAGIGILCLIWYLKSVVFMALESLSIVCLVTFGLFVFKAAPVSIGKGSVPIKETREIQTEDKYPIFFLTFEKLVHEYFLNERGEFDSKKFPNLARFIETADYYPNAYANTTATVWSLETLYTGELWNQAYPFWKTHPHIRGLLGSGRKVIMLLDLLDYCDGRRDTCVRSVGTSAIHRFDIILGWYKTYVKTAIPQFLAKRLELYDWSFNPWTSMWDKEVENLKPGEDPLDKIGKRQFESLKTILRQEKSNPNLYIMHNFISDNPGAKSSIFPGRTKAEFLKDKEITQANLEALEDALGSFLDLLRDIGIYDQSLIVITSDTGYDPGARDLQFQETLPLSSELTRVFLAIKKTGQKRGNRVDKPFQQIDMLPTLLKHLNLPTEGLQLAGQPVDFSSNDNAAQDRNIVFYLGNTRGSAAYQIDRKNSLMRRLKD